MILALTMRARAVALVAAALALGVPAPGADGPARAQTLDTVTVGYVNSVADTPFLIAEGSFRDAGIEVKFTTFASGATMIASAGSGDLDAGGGAPAAGLYNAVARGIGIKIVADRATDAPGYGFNVLLVRKELVTSGRYKKLSDLKGMRFAEPGKGSTSLATTSRLLEKAGLKYDDVEHVFLGFPEQVAALKNGSIDARDLRARTVGHAGRARRPRGAHRRRRHLVSQSTSSAVLFYGNGFIQKRPEVAKRSFDRLRARVALLLRCARGRSHRRPECDRRARHSRCEPKSRRPHDLSRHHRIERRSHRSPSHEEPRVGFRHLQTVRIDRRRREPRTRGRHELRRQRECGAWALPAQEEIARLPRALVIGTSALFVVLVALAIARTALWTYGADAGTFAQIVLDSFGGMRDGVEHGTHFRFHWSPALALLWPLMALSHAVLALQIVQIVATVAVPPLVYALVRPYAGARLATRIGVLALVYPPLIGIGFSEFHESASSRRWPSVSCSPPTGARGRGMRSARSPSRSCAKTSRSSWRWPASAFRIVGMLAGRSRALAVAGLASSALAVASLAFYYGAVVPGLGGWMPAHFYTYPFAAGPLALILAPLLHPGAFFAAVLTLGRLTYVLEIFAPLALLPLTVALDVARGSGPCDCAAGERRPRVAHGHALSRHLDSVGADSGGLRRANRRTAQRRARGAALDDRRHRALGRRADRLQSAPPAALSQSELSRPRLGAPGARVRAGRRVRLDARRVVHRRRHAPARRHRAARRRAGVSGLYADDYDNAAFARELLPEVQAAVRAGRYRVACTLSARCGRTAAFPTPRAPGQAVLELACISVRRTIVCCWFVRISTPSISARMSGSPRPRSSRFCACFQRPSSSIVVCNVVPVLVTRRRTIPGRSGYACSTAFAIASPTAVISA